MDWIKTFSLLALAGFVFAGCSNKVYVEKDRTANFSNYRSYAVVDARSSEGDTVSRPGKVSDLTDREFKQAVNESMLSSGLTQNNRRPDVLVMYDVLQERGTHQTSYSSGYGSPFSSWYFNPYSHGWYSLYYPSQFMGYNSGGEYQDNDRTITISIIDANTNKTVLQGWTTNHSGSRRLTSGEIQSTVQSIFRKFNLAKR